MSRIFPRVLPFIQALLLVASILAPGTSKSQSIENVISWTDELTLEENEEVLTVQPRVSLDPSGGFVIADGQERQVRLYDEEGTLKQAFGQKGRGPSEFRYLIAAVRLPSGNVVAAEFTGNVSVFDPSGTFLRRFRVPVRIIDLQRLPDGSLLLVGDSASPTEDRYYLLHRLNLKTEKIDSFFPLPVSMDRYGKKTLPTLGSTVAAEVRGDTIAATFALETTLYFFTLQGERIGKREFELNHFTRARSFGGDDISSFKEWVTTFSTIRDIFWLNDGSFLLQYAEILDIQTREREYSLARVNEDGTLTFDISKTPQLLTVNPKTRRAFFVHPDSKTRNRWAVGRLSMSSQ